MKLAENKIHIKINQHDHKNTILKQLDIKKIQLNHDTHKIYFTLCVFTY